jgi:hypothetical protein
MIKKADIVLAVILLAAGIASSIFLFFGGGIGETVIISVDTKVYGNYDLKENQIIDVKSAGNHFNIVEIKDGKAFVTDADCPDKLCIKQGKINNTSQSIVCLPNKVMIELIGPESDGPDAYSS